MSLNKFTPIAMKCNKEQWEDIKPLLVKDNILTRHIISFDYDTYLTNNYMDIKLNISNVPIWSASFFKRNIYSEWDKNIFLNACGIEEEFVLPEKWCIVTTSENFTVVKLWLQNVKNYGLYNCDWSIGNIYCIDEGIKVSGWMHYAKEQKKGYTEITYKQFCKYVLKQEIKTNMNNKFPFYLNPNDAQKIIDSACSQWKTQLATIWANSIVLNKQIEIREEFYKEMRNACSVEQHRLFDSIFGKDVEDFPYKVGDWIAIDGVVAKITEINTDSSHIYWIKHTPNANTGGGFSFKCYKNRIRFATSEEIAKAICPYKDGELIWVKTNGVWLLRYSNGKITSSGDAEVYYNQLKDGSVTRWPIHRKAEGITLPE
jgi:hypothetical protein